MFKTLSSYEYHGSKLAKSFEGWKSNLSTVSVHVIISRRPVWVLPKSKGGKTKKRRTSNTTITCPCREKNVQHVGSNRKYVHTLEIFLEK